MAQPSEPSPVKFICGMIASDVSLFDAAAGPLTTELGPIDIASDVMPFDLTDYYAQQMGAPLYRKLVAFETLASPERLVAVKCRTNAIEADFAAASPPDRPPRPINIDPGYVAPTKLVLASMKDFAHRIYLGRGVYAEVTLFYRHGKWLDTEWTFPDYASGRYDAFLTAARSCLRDPPREARQ